MKKYLIASDIDHTLIKEKDIYLTSNTKKIINEIRKNNNIFVIVTGRVITNAIRLFKDNCDYIVGTNGTIIYDNKNKEIIYEDAISQNTCKQILNYIGNDYERCSICTKDNWLTKLNKKYEKKYQEELIINRIEMPKKVYKFEIHYDTEYELELAEKRLTSIKNIKIIKEKRKKTLGGNLDIFKNNNDKYNALKIISEIENISNDNVIAFGDNMNDYNMIKNVGIGVAVANANEKIKSIADDITTSNEDEGVYKWLEKNFIRGTIKNKNNLEKVK